MMMTLTRVSLAVLLTVVAASAWVHAGSVRLVNNYYNTICKVEVIKGINAPQTGSPESYSNVAKGVVTSAEGRLCFRRSADPANCASPLTEWRCADKGTSGTLEFNLY